MQWNGYILQYTFDGVYRLTDEIIEVIISLMMDKMIYWAPLGKKVKYISFTTGVPWALPLRTPSGKEVYLTVYPSSRPNTDRE